MSITVSSLTYFFTLFRTPETLSQHFSPRLCLCLAEAQALSGYMIHNLSQLMSRLSVRVCCVCAYVYMFLFVSRCVLVPRVSHISTWMGSKNCSSNPQTRHILYKKKNLKHQLCLCCAASGFKVVMETLLPWLLRYHRDRRGKCCYVVSFFRAG